MSNLMTGTRSFISYSFTSLHMEPSHRTSSFFFKPVSHSHLQIAKTNNNRYSLPSGNRTSQQYFSTISKGAGSYNTRTNMDMAVHSSVQPGSPSPPPSGAPPNSWRNWLLGLLVTVIVPFLSHKWGPLLKWTKEVETAVENLEDVVEVVEEVAEAVDNVAEAISDELPEGGKLKKAIDFIEDEAEEVAKDAHLAEEFIDKVQEVEEKVESVIADDPVVEVVKEPNDDDPVVEVVKEPNDAKEINKN